MFIEDKIFSKALNKKMEISLFIPSECENIKLPVLYFLHGRTGNHKLIEQLDIENIVNKLVAEKKIKPFIIVCPDMDNSRGINSSNEYKEVQGKYGTVHLGLYEDYLIKEIIPYIDKNYKTICNRENRYIGGISSGGYIALHNGLRHQDLFSKIGGHMPEWLLTKTKCWITEFKVEKWYFVMWDNRWFSTDSLCCFGLWCYDWATYEVTDPDMIWKVMFRVFPNFGTDFYG